MHTKSSMKILLFEHHETTYRHLNYLFHVDLRNIRVIFKTVLDLYIKGSQTSEH